jgi:metallophosphoesterase superfamily enzyme
VNYKTVPDGKSREIRMASGGDVGMNKFGRKMTSYLVDYNPDIILIGGDTVYDNGMRSCYNPWDNFYDMFEVLNQKLNRLVPLVMSVGNHDVGFNALEKPGAKFNRNDVPYFFLFNPQHSSTDSSEVPHP